MASSRVRGSELEARDRALQLRRGRQGMPPRATNVGMAVTVINMCLRVLCMTDSGAESQGD